MGNLTPAPDAYTSVVPYITNFIDLVPFKSLYLHCNEISKVKVKVKVKGRSCSCGRPRSSPSTSQGSSASVIAALRRGFERGLLASASKAQRELRGHLR